MLKLFVNLIHPNFRQQQKISINLLYITIHSTTNMLCNLIFINAISHKPLQQKSDFNTVM